MPVAGTVFPAGMRRRPWAVGIALVASAAATVAVLKPDVDAAANAAFDAASLLPSPTKDSLSQALVVRLGAELSAWTSPQPADQPSESRRRILRVTVIGDSAIVRITGVPELTYRTARATIDSAGVLPSRIVRELLAGGDDAAFPGLHELPIRSGVVLRWFTDGHRLLERGQLDSARAAFAVAADSAPQFAAAHFWSAQAAAWGATPFDERTRRHIADAVRIGRKSRYDSLLVVALAHLAGQRYTEACAAYGEAKHIDARSYVAALGQGECQRQNPVVLMRRGAVAFQTSHWAALQAYREGLESAPSSRLAFALLPKLSRLTYSAGSEMRAGRTVDGRSYFALPSRSADSLAFFPVDSQVFVTGGPGAVPASWSDALRLGRMTAAAIASSMTTRFPEDPLLWLERAIALERAGSIDPAIRPSAYSAAQEAERLGARESAALDLTLLRIRLAIRRGLLDSAVVMARSLLSGRDTTTMTPSRREARMRAMATLVKDRGTLSRAPAPGEDTLPASVRAPYRTFVNAVLLDDCREARSAAGLLERSVAAALPAAARDAADRFLLSTSRAGTTCLGAIALAKLSPAGTPLDRALLELAKGNKANALRAMATTSALRSGATASALTWNYLSLEAWMRREAGDTSGSVSLILDALEDLPSMSAYTMEDAEQVAGLRRALRILHEIDRARPGSAGRWRDVAKD